MELDKDSLKILIHEILDERKESNEFFTGISKETHYIDHKTYVNKWKDQDLEFQRNHRFVSNLLDSSATAKKAGIWTFISSLATLVTGLIFYLFKKL